MTIKKIAATMNLSPKTVEHYLNTVKQKLKVCSRAELVAKALKIPTIQNQLLD
jgi:DNA-binding NarL/FixJ family response regulator